MENTPLISVIVPVYNVEAYIRECVDSILNQSYANLEIILVDDGSNDSSGIICDEYARKDIRVRVVHKKNGGLSSARNAGLAKMNGAYVGFVDSDDWIEPDMYENMLHIAVEHEAEIVTCRICSSNEVCTTKDSDVQIFDMEAAMFSLLEGGKVSNSVCDKLFLASVTKDILFPEGMSMEDAATVYKYIFNAHRVATTSKDFYRYRIREGSILHTAFSARNFNSVKATKMRLDDISRRHPEFKQKAANGYVWTALYCIWWADHAAHGKYDSERNAIADEMLQYLKQNKDIVISDRVMKTKILLLRIGGVQLHDLVWNSYHKMLRVLNK